MRIDELEPHVSEPVGGEPPLRASRFRAWLAAHPFIRLFYRILLGTVGALIIATGIVMLPTPVPGWLIIFTGLALLGTEFEWARRIARWLKAQLARLWAWWRARRARRRAE